MASANKAQSQAVQKGKGDLLVRLAKLRTTANTTRATVSDSMAQPFWCFSEQQRKSGETESD